MPYGLISAKTAANCCFPIRMSLPLFTDKKPKLRMRPSTILERPYLITHKMTGQMTDISLDWIRAEHRHCPLLRKKISHGRKTIKVFSMFSITKRFPTWNSREFLKTKKLPAVFLCLLILKILPPDILPRLSLPEIIKYG